MSEGNGKPEIDAVSVGQDATNPGVNQSQAENPNTLTRREVIEKGLGLAGAAVAANTATRGGILHLIGSLFRKAGEKANQPNPSEVQTAKPAQELQKRDVADTQKQAEQTAAQKESTQFIKKYNNIQDSK